ncbi:MAG TPA: hypothetical protein VL068_03170 [Microthrixaceae bacterium]|nr:hypothetical protein [Microthrixaceae bacterium]
MATAIETILEVLEEEGFERLPKPLVAAGTAFDFDAAARGTGVSHDLVVIATSAPSSRRLVQLLSGLTRTLDQVQSRRPVSLVFVGEPPGEPTAADLERHARVLPITTEVPTADEVRRAISVLLPLSLPPTSQQGHEPLDEVAASLGTKLSDEHRHLIEEARIGPEAVRDALREYIDAGARGDSTEGARR